MLTLEFETWQRLWSSKDGGSHIWGQSLEFNQKLRLVALFTDNRTDKNFPVAKSLRDVNGSYASPMHCVAICNDSIIPSFVRINGKCEDEFLHFGCDPEHPERFVDEGLLPGKENTVDRPICRGLHAGIVQRPIWQVAGSEIAGEIALFIPGRGGIPEKEGSTKYSIKLTGEDA